MFIINLYIYELLENCKLPHFSDLAYIMAENDMVVLAFKREYPDPERIQFLFVLKIIGTNMKADG